MPIRIDPLLLIQLNDIPDIPEWIDIPKESSLYTDLSEAR
jgi:hypothetical protein